MENFTYWYYSYVTIIDGKNIYRSNMEKTYLDDFPLSDLLQKNQVITFWKEISEEEYNNSQYYFLNKGE